MSKFTETKVDAMIVGQTVALPTEHGGTHNGRIIAITPAPGRYAKPGALDVTLVYGDDSTVTLRTNANYSGYVTDDTITCAAVRTQRAHLERTRDQRAGRLGEAYYVAAFDNANQTFSTMLVTHRDQTGCSDLH